MKIVFVSVENGIASIGFRKIASFARSIHPETEVCYIVPMNLYSMRNALFDFGNIRTDIPENDIAKIARHLANSDMVCFSSMTPFASLTKKIIRKIRNINPEAFIVWGGIHPIVCPEDAIEHADAVCTGEGESAFSEFLAAYKGGGDYTKTGNFWFSPRTKEETVIKNGFLPLQTPEDMEGFPFPLYIDQEKVFKSDAGFVNLDRSEYISSYGIVYMTIWSIGCPNKCTYCSNYKFIDNDKGYRKIRHTSVDYIINEVKKVLMKTPYISTVQFLDDGFLAIPFSVLEEFCDKWKREVNLPFIVSGAFPGYVTKRKIKKLISSGMLRIRMGIQSGSNSILRFYNRPANIESIMKAVNILSEFSNYMSAPSYDIILDNPIETKEDVIATLKLLYNMPRPYNLQVYCLSVIPNTQLETELNKLEVSHHSIINGYLQVQHSLGNTMVFMLPVLKPPEFLFNMLLKHVRAYSEKQAEYPVTFFIFRTLWLLKRGFGGLLHMDFSEIPGRSGWIFWRLGIMKMYHKMRRSRKLPPL